MRDEPGLVAHPRDLGANGVHEVDEGLVERAFNRARPRQPHAMGGNDAAWPRAHDEDDVGEVGGFAQVMGHQHAGELAVEPQLLQHAPELLAGKGIERAKWLIQHQQLRIVYERPAQACALLHAAREHPRLLVLEPGEPDRRQQLLGLRDILVFELAQPMAMRPHDLQRQHRVQQGVAPRQQCRVLERHAHDLERTVDIGAGDADGSARARHQAGDELHQRRLAATGRPDHGGEFATADAERRTVERERAIRTAVTQRDAIHLDEFGRSRPQAAGSVLHRRATAYASFRSAAGGRNRPS